MPLRSNGAVARLGLAVAARDALRNTRFKLDAPRPHVMMQSLAHVTLVVRDYDEAIAYFSRKLGFVVVEDRALDGGKRFVRVAPPGSDRGASLLLARAATPEQESRVGNQTGGRVFLFLHTEDFDRDHALMASRGVDFVESPREESYGKVVVFTDLYGNRWDLVERRP